jgi:uncharacterized membrane protein
MIWKRYWLIGAVVAMAMSWGGGARAAEDNDALAGKVFGIFKEKCFSCHSPAANMSDAQAKKGMKHLDYIDDFAQLRANSKLIVAGDLDKSLVYKQVAKDEMPPDDSEIPALSEMQKDAVKQWVLAGAPVGKTVALARPVAAAGPVRQRTFMARLIEFLGKFHPLAAHTPIAVLMAAAIAEALYLRHPAPALTGAARFCAILGALGAIATATLGWAMATTKPASDDLELHRWMGTIAAAACIPIAILGEWGARRAHHEGRKWHGFSRWAFRLSIFGIAGMVGFTAHLGGLMVWGKNLFDFPK